MKQRLFIFAILLFLIILLAGLNAATYVQKEKVPDTELAPNRSTYNSGSTGTKAFYSLLYETGRPVTRWQESLETISSESRNRPAVFVMIGPFRRPLDETESTQLLRWTSAGGTLVLIDREPPKDLIVTSTQWQTTIKSGETSDLFSVDSTNQRQMTNGMPAQKPALPSYFSTGVNAVQPSRFASSVGLERFRDHAVSPTPVPRGYRPAPPTPAVSPTPYDFYSGSNTLPAPPPRQADEQPYEDEETEEEDEATVPGFDAPIVHLAGSGRHVLVEAPFGAGRIVILTDPFIVANNGINLVDNSRLAINVVTSREGLIAFDEYHHGFGADNNRFFQYFEGTPVIAIFIQLGLIAGLVLFSQSRRFARAVPEREASRLSKLEYVSAMAELQARASAYDLAIENIYTDFRRRAAASLGLDNQTVPRRELSAKIAERTGGDARTIDKLLFDCEDVIRGEPLRRKDTVDLVDRLRRLESQLGLKRTAKGH